MKNVMIVLQVLILLTLTGYAEADVKPIPNGVVFDGVLSVAVAKIERGTDTIVTIVDPQKVVDSTTVWLAFRKFSKDMSPVRGSFTLRVIDDRQNKYERRCTEEIFPNRGRGLIDLPAGFTWVVPIKILEMPRLAPISKVELEEAKSSSSRTSLELNFRKAALPDLNFDTKPGQIISPGQQVQLDGNLSFSMDKLALKGKTGNLDKEGFNFSLLLKVKNADYNSRAVGNYNLAVQLEDGRFFQEDVRGLGAEALSTKDCELEIDLGFKKVLGEVISIPRTLFLYGASSCTLIPVPNDLKHQCLNMQKEQLLLEGVKPKFLDWYKQRYISEVSSSNMSKRHPNYLQLRLQNYQPPSINGGAVAGTSTWLVSAGELFYTENHGENWRSLWDPDDGQFLQINFLGKRTGLFATKNSIFKTYDAGYTWNKILTVEHIGQTRLRYGREIKELMIQNERLLSVRLQTSPAIIETTDGGISWILMSYKTNDAGMTWKGSDDIEVVSLSTSSDDTQVVSSQTEKKKPEPKPQDKIKEVEKTVKKAESIYGIFKRR